MIPALAGARLDVFQSGRRITSGRLRANGSFRIGVRPRTPGAYTVSYAGVASPAAQVAVRPRLTLTTSGAPVVGAGPAAVAAVQPAAAGTVTLHAYRRGALVTSSTGRGTARLKLPSGRPGSYRIVASVVPASGYLAERALLDAVIREPLLAYGSRGAGVRELERRLRSLRFVLQRVDSHYGRDTLEAVLAFQKLHSLPRTGRVDRRVWQALAAAREPRARYGGDHIEVDKRRQLLMLVRGGRVTLVAHVSTGATGNTPVGRWRVYRKVAGWDWVLWYPMYFIGGYAIHGYPEVPAWPASHGCVRVPMWLAPRLFAGHSYGTTIIVY
jgi:peptidoglycan hydrolase-like protein with peptidoglycan-binding domain